MATDGFRLVPVVVLMTLLGGCFGTVGQYHTVDKFYWLEPQLAGAQGKALAHLFIPKVQISPALDSERIVLFQSGLQQGFVPNSRWPGRLSDYFYVTVLETLSRSNAFLSVSDRPSANKSAYKLLLRLSAFHAEYPPAPHHKANVVLGMEALLIDSKSQRIVSQYRYDRRKENVASDVNSIVFSLNQLLSETLTVLISDLSKGLPKFY